jgi:hypothetical protein
MTDERQQRAAERILEDEGLTGDLTDQQARPLIEWASAKAASIAADPARSDAEVHDAVSAVRRAVLGVAAAASPEHEATRLIALAEQHVAESLPGPTSTLTNAIQPAAPQDTCATAEVHQETTPASPSRTAPDQPIRQMPICRWAWPWRGWWQSKKRKG